jgi:hypothetical protein
MQRLTLSAIAEGSHGKDGNMQFAVRNAIAGGPDDRIIEPEF